MTGVFLAASVAASAFPRPRAAGSAASSCFTAALWPGERTWSKSGPKR